MPILLAIDTSTEACSVALLVDRTGDGPAFHESYIEAAREHMLRLLPMVDELLTAHQLTLRDLDCIVFARGPGSFTGLRITLGVVQGLAFGAEIPVLPVSTLAILAQTIASEAMVGSYIFSAIDARMDEVYCAWFEVGADGLVVARSDECVCAPEAIPIIDIAAPCYGVGSGWNYAPRFPPLQCVTIDSAALPRASAALRLALPRWVAGEAIAAEAALPVYLRNDVAWAKTGVAANNGAPQ
jgi:tRNA threonylcarbamoyladenosine biosynthesis protein TsaB